MTDEQEEIERARTVPIPGGVKLNGSEQALRDGWVPKGRGLALKHARSILAKVRVAVGLELAS